MSTRRVLAVWAAGRALSTLLLLAGFWLGAALGWGGGRPRPPADLGAYFASWDGSWFARIAAGGYPAQLPLTADGAVAQNPWAFLPVFPALCRALMLLGLSFPVAGVLVASLASAAASLLLHRLLRAVAGGGAGGGGGPTAGADAALALFCFGPLAFLGSVAYADTTFLALWFGALLAAVRRRWLLLAVLGVVAALTRPGAIALVVVIAVIAVLRRAEHGWAERMRMAVAALALVAATAAWPLIAAAVTARPSAYLETELAWWTGYLGRVEFVPGTPWFRFATQWLGPAGILLVVGAILGAVLVLRSRAVRRLGAELLAASGGYLAYLVAVFLPQQSLPRLLLPLMPLAGAPGRWSTRMTRRRAATLLSCAALLQAAAIVPLWVLGYP